MKIGAVIIVGVALFLALFGWAISRDLKQKRDFMAECEADRPHYECVALWRGGQDRTTLLIIPN